ncbi:uncharacterized protein LOC107286514 [Protobothrops mucrosquamatus]|uniref:uncharacterized protein LOC107286514 n=1 Tax=Protobothrops mucrosquamatus TaxID=103944 RepID=UPI000775FDD2|nr:uncharacterized protein LOC107286514 [Protobothrops mucrosquamatus]
MPSAAPGPGSCFMPFPPSSDSGDNPQDPARTGGGRSNFSTLAETSVVRRSGGAFHLPPPEDPSRSYCPQPGSPSTSRSSVAPTNHLALERRALTRDSYSSRVIAMIQQSKCPSTNRIYDATWRNFCLWCSGHQVQLSAITIPIVLEYLMDGLEKGLSLNTIRRQVLVLSTVLCDNSAPLAHHPTVCSFIKGATNAKPPAVHRYPSWDLSRVLQALTSPPFEPIKACTLRLLSMKVAFLVAVSSAR